MNQLLRSYLVPLLFITCGVIRAQETQKIRFSKNSDMVYFFQIGNKSDNVIKNESDRFYFVLNDSLKANIYLDVENGKFNRTENDSILKLEFLPGMKYETVYLKKAEEGQVANSKSHLELKTQVNGASEFDKYRIRIRVVDRRRNEILMENVYRYFY